MKYRLHPLSAVVWLIIMLTGGYVRAQLLVGPKAGVQFSRFTFADEDYNNEYTSSFKPGFNIGGVMEFKVKKPFSLHTEFFYSRKGKIIEEKEGTVRSEATYHHLDVPALLRLTFDKTIKEVKFQYYFNIGPNFSYWMGGKGILQSPELYEKDYEQLDYKVRFIEDPDDPERQYGSNLYVIDANRLLANLEIGGGLMFDMGRKRKLMIDFRYGFGIGNSFLGTEKGGDFGLYEYAENFEAVNNVLSVSVAYLFDINVMQILRKGKYR